MRLHERNRDFAWSAAPAPYRRLSDEQVSQYNADGYFVFRQAFTSSEIATVRDAIDPLEAEFEQMHRDRFDGQIFIAKADAITFTTHLVTRSAALKEFSKHQVLRDICHDTMGSNARLYWDQAVYKKAHNPDEFPWHQDNGYTFVEPQQYLTCWIPLTDATLDNGCPWVVPGVHRSGTLHHEVTPIGLACFENPVDPVSIPVEVGDIAVFSSLTPHRTGPNRTGDTRKSYILQYALDGATMYPLGDEPQLANNPDRQYLVSEE